MLERISSSRCWKLYLCEQMIVMSLKERVSGKMFCWRELNSGTTKTNIEGLALRPTLLVYPETMFTTVATFSSTILLNCQRVKLDTSRKNARWPRPPSPLPLDYPCGYSRIPGLLFVTYTGIENWSMAPSASCHTRDSLSTSWVFFDALWSEPSGSQTHRCR